MSDPTRKSPRRPTRRSLALAVIPIIVGTVAVALPTSAANTEAAAAPPAAGPPWDGTPISPGLGPTYGEEWCAPTEGEYVDEWQGPPLALMPYAAVGCTLDKIRQEAAAAGVPRRLRVQEVGSSTVNDRPIYGVVVDARETPAQRLASDHWQRIRRLALTDPERAGDLIGRWGDTTKVPIYVQGNIHGDEVEGTDALMQIIRDLATTPRGTHPDVDFVLDNLILVFVPTLNPDGRVAGIRRNGNNFDMNRDFFTQSQDEVKASVSVMRDWLPVSMLDLHGYYNPTEVDGQTKPHNPGIEYDLYQPWNIDRVHAVTDAMDAAGYETQVPVFDWCPDAEFPDPLCVDGNPPSPKTAQGFDDWGPFYTPTYAQLSGAMDTSTIEMCWSSCGESLGSKTVQYVSVWATMRYVAEHAEAMLSDQMEVYERGVEGAPRADCCPEPFGSEHNWMTPYPKAYVIPFNGNQRRGGDQRSDAEANRLVDWLLFQELEVTRSKRTVTWRGQTFPKGSYVVWMDQPKRGLVDTTLSIGEDLSDRVDTLYAPPAAWSHGWLWGATTVQIPADARFTPPTEPVRRVNRLETGPVVGRSDFYSIAVDAPAAVRAVNALAGRGLPTELAREPFQSTSGGRQPAGTVIFAVPDTDRPAYRALVEVGRETGVTFDRNRGVAAPSTEPIDRVPRIAVLADVQDQAVWALESLGFDADAVPTGRDSELNDPNAPDPLSAYDIVYSVAAWPGGRTTRQRLTAFFDSGGGYIGAGPDGAAFIGADGARQLRGLVPGWIDNSGQSGILRWRQIGGPRSPLTGAYPAEDTAIADPIAWFAKVPASATIDARLAGEDAFEAGLWRPADRTAPPHAPLVVHGASTADGSRARIAAFALDPLYRADPEREWPMLASAAYWLDR
jgi:Zinc carboxypeptidase